MAKKSNTETTQSTELTGLEDLPTILKLNTFQAIKAMSHLSSLRTSMDDLMLRQQPLPSIKNTITELPYHLKKDSRPRTKQNSTRPISEE